MSECSPCDLDAIAPIDRLPGGTPQLQCPTCGRVDTIDNWTNLVVANLRARKERARVKKDKTRANFTPHWQGTIRGFHTYGADPWQICIELPPGPNVFDGTSAPGPSVRFSRGQEVHVLTGEGLAELKAQALEEAADELDALQTPENDHPSRRDPSAWLINRAQQIRTGEECR